MKKSNTKKIVIFGSAGHARVCIDIFQLNQHKILGLVDNNRVLKGGEVNGFLILGQDSDPIIVRLLSDPHTDYFVAIGDNEIRKKVTEWLIKILKKPPINAIHPDTTISRFAKLGYGNFVNCGVKINANAIIGNNTIINTSTTIDHDSVLEDYAQISPGTNLAGNVLIGQSAFIGTGAVIIPGVKIGQRTTIGAGAVVIKDIPSKVAAAGCPAKIIKNL